MFYDLRLTEYARLNVCVYKLNIKSVTKIIQPTAFLYIGIMYV